MSGIDPENGDPIENPEPEADAALPGQQEQDGEEGENLEAESESAAYHAHSQEEPAINQEEETAEGQNLDSVASIRVSPFIQDDGFYEPPEPEAAEDEITGQDEEFSANRSERKVSDLGEDAEADCEAASKKIEVKENFQYNGEGNEVPVVVSIGAADGYRAGESTHAEDEQDLNGNNSEYTGAEWALEPEDSIIGNLNAEGAEGGQYEVMNDEAESQRLDLPLETHRTESDNQLAARDTKEADNHTGIHKNEQVPLETVESLHLIENLGAASDESDEDAWETNSLPEEEDYGPEGDICLTVSGSARNEMLGTEADQELELSTGAAAAACKQGGINLDNQEWSDVSCPECVEIRAVSNSNSEVCEAEVSGNANSKGHTNGCDANANSHSDDQSGASTEGEFSSSHPAKQAKESFEPECDQSILVTHQKNESSQSELEVVSVNNSSNLAEASFTETCCNIALNPSLESETAETESNNENNVITLETDTVIVITDRDEDAGLGTHCDRSSEIVNIRTKGSEKTDVSGKSILYNEVDTVQSVSQNETVVQRKTESTENDSGEDMITYSRTDLSNGHGAIPKSKKFQTDDDKELSELQTSHQNSNSVKNILEEEHSGVDSEDELLSELDATLKNNSDRTSLRCAISGKDELDLSICCEQCARNNLKCSLPNGIWNSDGSSIPDLKSLKRQLHQAKQMLMERECEISRLKSDVEEKTERYETLILERDAYQKEVDCLKQHNTDDLYLPQIKELEYTIAQQQTEIRGLKDKLSSHDSAAKKAIAALQSEMRLRVDQLTKTCEEAIKEKDSMVVKYAQAEHKNLEYVKHAERLDARLKEVEKEKEGFVGKFKAVKEHRTKIGAELEAKIAELHNAHRDLDKFREQMSSADTRVKWAQNKLKAELEAHKETKVQLEKANIKIKEAKEETQQIRRDCQAMIKTYQESEEVKSNSLDKELKLKESELLAHQQQQNHTELEHVKTLREMEQLKTELAESKTERTGLKERISKLETEQDKNQLTISKYSEIIQRQKKEIAELRERIESLVHVKSDFTRAQELIKTLDSEISDLKVNNKDLVADMEACRRRETDKLEMNAKLSKKNAELQSENTTLSNKVLSLTGELQSLKMENQDVETKLKDTSDALANEKKLREEETQSLNTQLAGKCKAVEDLMRKVEEEKDEIKTLKRKHTNNVKDLTRQLQQVRKKLENYEVTSNGDKDTVSLGSRTSSNGSLNTVGLPEQGNAAVTTSYTAVHNQPAPQVRQPSPEQEHPLITEQVEVNKQVLIERIVKLQRLLARKNEKIEFMDDHISQLVDEIQKKNRIIQNYILREEAGTMTSESVDQMKAELARKQSIMGSLYNSHSTDGTMTLDLSLEINRKLQAVLEDTLLKNMTLKESLDTLGQEIARLSQENRNLQLKFQGKQGTRTKPR